MVFLGTLNPQLTICKYLSTEQPLNRRGGCYDLHPVYNWVHHCIISILLVFMIAFLPLLFLGHEVRDRASSQLLFESSLNRIFLAEPIERGTGRALARLGKQFVSFSPMFEVFSTQTYTLDPEQPHFRWYAVHCHWSDWTWLRNVTDLIQTSCSFSRFAGLSIYLGMR